MMKIPFDWTCFQDNLLQFLPTRPVESEDSGCYNFGWFIGTVFNTKKEDFCLCEEHSSQRDQIIQSLSLSSILPDTFIIEMEGR